MWTQSDSLFILHLTTATFFVWYLIAVLFEFLFPGFVSNYVNLDLFLWIVILLAVFSLFTKRQ